MRLFLDSSALAKRYILEDGSEKVEDLCSRGSALGLCVICFPEIISAFNRKRRDKDLSSHDYAQLKTRLVEEIKDADMVQLTPKVLADAITLLEASALRAMDALHVASAVEWQADLFLTSDKRQFQAAKKAKLKCQLV
jgi:predicted nucleic acid-binding protein